MLFRSFSRRGILDQRLAAEHCSRLVADYDIRADSLAVLAGQLSGGNQQKAVLARELHGEPRLLLAAQPTRGLDVGAIEFVHRRLVEDRDKGRAILLISLELEDIRSLSDRALVICEGQIVAELPPNSSEEEFGVVMTGGGRREAA